MPITKTPLPTWNKKVKKALIDKNMTVKELANIVGYSAVYVRNIVNGKIVNATIAQQKISEVLGIREC